MNAFYETELHDKIAEGEDNESAETHLETSRNFEEDESLAKN